METPEQYTVKTPEDMIRKHLAMMPEDNWYYQEPVKQAILDYSSELIKENERLRGTIGVECVKQLLEAREENKLYRDALSRIAFPIKHFQEDAERDGMLIDGQGAVMLSENAPFLKSIAEKVLSKFQPKKDETTSSGL